VNSTTTIAATAAVRLHFWDWMVATPNENACALAIFPTAGTVTCRYEALAAFTRRKQTNFAIVHRLVAGMTRSTPVRSSCVSFLGMVKYVDEIANTQIDEIVLSRRSTEVHKRTGHFCVITNL
jgi:hypothetical protein